MRTKDLELAAVPRKNFPEDRLPQTNRVKGKGIPDWGSKYTEGPEAGGLISAGEQPWR